MTEKEKMESGQLYDSMVPELAQLRQKAHNLCLEYNALPEQETQKREQILKELVPNSDKLYLQGPIQFDYGYLTTFGEGCYANFNLTVLDCCRVSFGSNVFIGPNCTFATPVHPLLAQERNGFVDSDGVFKALEYAKPIEVGDNCWLASNVTVCGGVKIGEGTVIGAGSVVTRDIPSGVLAAGNPCRVIRKLSEDDKIIK